MAHKENKSDNAPEPKKADSPEKKDENVNPLTSANSNADLTKSVDVCPPEDHKSLGPPPGKESDKSDKKDDCCDGKCDDCECGPECDKPCSEKDGARCGDYGVPLEEIKVENKEVKEKEPDDKFCLLRDKVPRSLRHTLEPLTRDLEDVCAQVTSLVHAYFNQPENSLEYGLLVVKVMEFVEDYRDLTAEEKKLVATRCILELLDETPNVPAVVKADLMVTIPGAIEAVIRMSKGEPLNREVSGAGIVESAYVVKRAFERIVQFVRDHKYEIADIATNVFLIAAEIMFVVGGFPALAGSQKKAIVIEVFTKLLTEYAKSDTGDKLEDHFVDAVLANLPTIVDTLVSVAEGKFSINTLLEKCAKCPWFVCCAKQ